MNEETKAQPSGAIAVERIYEQPPDAVSFYCEVAQVVATDSELVVQFYETIPGAPDHSGKITTVRARLGATITLSPKHALRIGEILVTKAGGNK